LELFALVRRKKLIEVALPLEAINNESAREKSIRHGHPSTLHLWWARRPLAACRAVLFAQFVDDPDSDPAYRRADGSVDEDAAGLKRAQLFNLIEELVKWENSNNDRIINAARAEIARCVASRLIEEGKLKKETIIQGKGEGKPHPKGPLSGEFRTAWELIVYGHGDLDALSRRTTRLCPPEVVNHFLATYAPPVLDPFAGGGSIPLEAQRLGLRAYASDLNPVPVLINKALIEIPPKFANQPPVNPEARKRLKTATYRGAEGLAEDVRYYGKWMQDEAEKRIGHIYPKVKITEEMAANRPDLRKYVGRELVVLAWIWARTVSSPDPSLGRVPVPLVRSYRLASKKGKEAYVRPVIDRDSRTYSFAVKTGRPEDGFDIDTGTVTRSGARCLLSGSPIPFDHVRTEALNGRMGARLMAIVCLGDRERVYLSPMSEQEQAARVPVPDSVPESDVPEKALGFRVQLYGMDKYHKLFTNRQLTALTTLAELVSSVPERVEREAACDRADYGNAVATYLGLAASKCADTNSTICSWMPGVKYEVIRNTFSRQALPMNWDYAEANPFASSSGDFLQQVTRTSTVLDKSVFPEAVGGTVTQVDARASLPVAEGIVVSTDPPYYDNIGYADLSDFFYIWLRMALRAVYPQACSTMLTPKSEELIATPHRHGEDRVAAKEFFEAGLREALSRAHDATQGTCPTAVYYAFKQAETGETGTASTGWETFLQGLIDSRFAITGTWPMRTERSVRSVGIGTNALASSVILSCVPREEDAPMATRREFLNALKRELPDAMRKLQIGNIAPVDLAQAAIGPGMAVFSRYCKVIESDGEAMTVRAALTLINQMLDEVLAEQEGEFDGDTRWAVSWFETHGAQEGPYGVAETLSKAKNTSVQGLVEAGVITARGGKVKLLARDEMPGDWDPITDTRSTCWEATQHLIRRLQHEGEQAAAELLTRLGGDYGERARDLAYRLYSICERKGWAQEALAYNSLVIAWSEISKLSRSVKEVRPTQADLF
jgi:putative DNA methylase